MANSVEPIFGPMLIGVFLNSILYGVFIVQAIIYHQNYKRDPKWIRYLVLYLFICETLNTLCDIGMMYEPLVARFGTERAVTRVPILFTADPMLTVLISTPVQLFVCWRIKVLFKLVGARFQAMSAFIAFLSICSFVGGISLSVFNGHIPKFSELGDARWAITLWLVSSAVVDLSITICLVYAFRKCRTGIKKTDNAMNRNIRLAIHTGAITSTFAILDFLVFQTVPQTSANFAFDFALGKLYSNSLLSTFNARAYSRNDVEDTTNYNILFGPQENTQSTSLDRPVLFPRTLSGNFELAQVSNDSQCKVDSISRMEPDLKRTESIPV